MRYFLILLLLYIAYKNKIKRRLCFLLSLIVLFFPLIKTCFYQFTYGQPDGYNLYQDSFDVKITPISDKKIYPYQKGAFSILYEKKAKIDLFARVVYVDFNDTFFSSFDYYSNALYDTISPVDLSVFIGSMANNWKNYKVNHEKRLMKVSGNVVFGEWENLHIIPANKNVRAGLNTLKKGDIISLKGFLVDWNPVGSNKKTKTALSFSTASEERAGGKFTWLCMQVFVTELSANGYVFM